LDFENTGKAKSFDFAIHSACRAGMVMIVNYLYNYFKNKHSVPAEFDIYTLDDYYGEDAALIACRIGCFNLIKYLHELCGHNFKNLNKNSENALLICVYGYKIQPSYSFLECINYLVEIVKVDITYMHEELLIMASGADIIKYIEEQLEIRGIHVKKKDLEKECQFLIEDEDNSKEPGANDLLKEIKIEDENSIISSISSGIRSKHIGSSILDLLE
jgi:hypothetical protein